MLKDITWGQYHSADSHVHRLDPRVKIRFTIVYIVLLLLDRNLPLFGFLTFVFLLALASSQVPVRKLVYGTKGLFLFIFLCSAIHCFTVNGTVLLSIGPMDVTKEGIWKATFVFWRMVLLIFMSSLLMYTTTPTRLTDGMEKCMHLSGGVAMGITIALRFVPILFDELDRILKAQLARGVDFKKGGIAVRIKKLGNVILPLFQNALLRAGRLGDAMDSRCYTGGKNRTKLHPLKYQSQDALAYGIMILVAGVGVWMVVKF